MKNLPMNKLYLYHICKSSLKKYMSKTGRLPSVPTFSNLWKLLYSGLGWKIATNQTCKDFLSLFLPPSSSSLSGN